MKFPKGERLQSVCRQCENPFDYVSRGRQKTVCPRCADTNAARAKAVCVRKLRLAPGEPEASDSEGLAAIAVMSQPETAVRLAIWEALESGKNLERIWKGLETIRPVSAQAIQQIERRALRKIRIALQPEWEEYKRQRTDSR